MKRINGQYYFDWLTISIYRPLLLKNQAYRMKMVSTVLKVLPQTIEVKEAQSYIETIFRGNNGKYEEQLKLLGIRITCGTTILRIEFQGLAFTRDPSFFTTAINIYFNLWKKIKIVSNGVEYDPPKITAIHICKDYISKKVDEVLPLPSDPRYDFRFRYKYKPITRSKNQEMEGYHIKMGDYLLKAYRKDWEVLDTAYKKPIKYQLQKKIYGKNLNAPITRIELEVFGGRANDYLTNHFLEIFKMLELKKVKYIQINHVVIAKTILRKFYNFHRVLIIGKNRKRDWIPEKRWHNFFFHGTVLKPIKQLTSKLDTNDSILKKIKQYLSIASKIAILNGFDQFILNKELNLKYEEVLQGIESDKIIEQDIQKMISQEIIKKELQNYK